MKMYPLAENTIDWERKREREKKCGMQQEHNELNIKW